MKISLKALTFLPYQTFINGLHISFVSCIDLNLQPYLPITYFFVCYENLVILCALLHENICMLDRIWHEVDSYFV